MPKLSMMGAILLVLGAYALAPAVALLRLDRAMRHGDTAVVARLVDWPTVRQGLAQEVAEGRPAGRKPVRRAADALPPFGFSFVAGIADHAIAERLTPGELIGLARADAATGAPPARVRLAGVWFDGPTRVGVRLHVAGQRRPIRLWLQLEHGGWKLARIWLPPALLRRASDRGADRTHPGAGRRARPGAPGPTAADSDP